MFRVSTAAFVCALAFSAPAAMAASQSSAAITSLSFTLIDLNPLDGVNASFSILNTAGSTGLSVSLTDGAHGESETASRTRAGTFTFTKDYLAELASGNAKASVGTQSLSASGAAAGAQTSYNAAASTGANLNGYYYNQPLNLSLSANSVLLINANIELSASASNAPACTYYYYCSGSETSSASASLYLSYNYNLPGGSTSYGTQQSKSLQAVAQGGSSYSTAVYNPVTGWYEYVVVTTPGTDDNKSLTDVLTGVFTNSSSQSQLASLGVSVSVSGQASTAPAVPEPDVLTLVAAGALVAGGAARASAVPEPQSYLLILSGLGRVGWVAGRRRQR